MTINMPCLNTQIIPVEKIRANNYNPNKVATPEMKALERSIKMFGVTMPVVVFYDEGNDMYEIVDGFHRFTVLSKHLKQKQIPVSIIDKEIGERMVATVLHNRARGTHGIRPMSEIVLELSRLGWTDDKICENMGMELDEVIRLKQITGLRDAYANHTFTNSWTAFNRKYESELS